MFNVDLMNSTGLQKIISKGGSNQKTDKQKIIFQDEDYTNNDVEVDKNIDSKSMKPASFVSLLVAVSILGVFLFFGLINVNSNINLTEFTKYFKSTNNEAIAKSTAIKFLSNPEKSKILTSIDINENLTIKFKIEDILDYKLNEEDAIFFTIINK